MNWRNKEHEIVTRVTIENRKVSAIATLHPACQGTDIKSMLHPYQEVEHTAHPSAHVGIISGYVPVVKQQSNQSCHRLYKGDAVHLEDVGFHAE